MFACYEFECQRAMIARYERGRGEDVQRRAVCHKCPNTCLSQAEEDELWRLVLRLLPAVAVVSPFHIVSDMTEVTCCRAHEHLNHRVLYTIWSGHAILPPTKGGLLYTLYPMLEFAQNVEKYQKIINR